MGDPSGRVLNPLREPCASTLAAGNHSDYGNGMSIAELIYDKARNLPASAQAEVLEIVEKDQRGSECPWCVHAINLAE